MGAFADRTGIGSGTSVPRRYLWTDGFAVFNLLSLHQTTRQPSHLALALQLVDQVHSILGRHRQDDARSGWISGLSEAEGKHHPTISGLRIGKPLPERRADQPFDERLEWERDGQYFHYLTKWMQALHRVFDTTGDSHFRDWGLELALRAHRGFVIKTPGRVPRMVWKMSIDLTRPLVPSMGSHDPLDGLVSFAQLRAASDHHAVPPDHRLDEAIADMAAMCHRREWQTTDELGIGELLSSLFHLTQLIAEGELDEPELLHDVLVGATRSLTHYSGHHHLDAPAETRLAFRELGLAIGLRALPGLFDTVPKLPGRVAVRGDLEVKLRELERHADLGERIEAFWLEPGHRTVSSWKEHEDINAVMLATSLTPQAYLWRSASTVRRTPA